MINTTNRVSWISILQAITIAAVVIGHIDLTGDHNPDYPIASWIDYIVQFQMPVFFFISGYLYVRSSLYKKSYIHLMKAKWMRLCIPFLFITIVMYVFKLQLPHDSLAHPVELSGKYIFKMLVDPWNGPARHMWFLFTLFTYFLLMPLYVNTLKNSVYSMIMIIVAYLMQVALHEYPILNQSIFSIGRSLNYFLYFYLGMVAMKYDLIKYLQSKYALIICTVLYLLSFSWEVPFNGFWGIGMIVSLSYFIAEWRPTLFSSYSKYSYQIYLMHIPPIMLCRMVYRKEIITDIIWFPICWIMTLLIGIYAPVLVCKAIERLSPKFRILIGL